MKRVLYCAELNAIAIAHETAVDNETGKHCCPVEWDYKDMFNALQARKNRNNFEGICPDISDLFSWEFIGELE